MLPAKLRLQIWARFCLYSAVSDVAAYCCGGSARAEARMRAWRRLLPRRRRLACCCGVRRGRRQGRG